MVIENHPRLADGSPFPTLFWLTCPILVKRVGTLEAGGAMARLNETLERDAALRGRVEREITRYAARRDAREHLDDPGVPGGGPERVKCLHAHVAHELADPPNSIGARSLAETGWPDCVAPCVAVTDRGSA
jgi:hypothetical protein